MKKGLGFFVFVILVIAAGYLLNQFLKDNSEVLRLRFFLWQTKEVSLGLLVLMSFFLGLLVTFLFFITGFTKKSFETERFKRENAALQKILEMKQDSASKVSS